MRILMVTPEANPFAHSGGLAEVIFALAQTLVKLGHEVEVVLPLYRQVRESGRTLTDTGHTLSIPLSWKNLPAQDLYRGAGAPSEVLLHRPGRPVQPGWPLRHLLRQFRG